MHGPYQPLCVILTVCEQPPLSVCVCHGPQLPCMHQLELPLLRVSFMPNTAPWSSLSPTELPKDIHFLCAHKATSKHTHNASPTSEGLTQARPIEHTLQFHANIIVVRSSEGQGSSCAKTLAIFDILSGLLQVSVVSYISCGSSLEIVTMVLC